jgi:phosphoglycolate phosphatase-like HAD superfamily hydrolase
MITMPAPGKSCPLSDLADLAAAAVEQGANPQVVFDLDDTLFLVRPRKRAIFRELAETYGREHDLCEALHQLAEGEIPYDVAEALGTVGITHDHHVAALKKGFFDRFFDGTYTAHDAVNEGAVAYVNHLANQGVTVVYLTGRPEEMLPQTRETLAAGGFPVDERTRLILKETVNAKMADADFKGLKAAEIAAVGPVLATFDNEPANLNAMKAAMADARFFLLDTDHSPNPPALQMDVHVMGTFELERRTLATTLANSPSFKQGGSWTINVAAV